MPYRGDGIPGYDAWKTRAPEDEPGYWDDKEEGEDPDDEADLPDHEEDEPEEPTDDYDGGREMYEEDF